VVSGPLLLIIATIVERVRPEVKDWWRLGLLGLVLYGNQFCFMMGLKLTDSATQTAIIQQCIPVFTAGLTIVLKLEKFSIIKMIGLAFAVSGAIVMIGFKNLSLDNNRTIGMLILLGNTMLMSTYYVMQKPLLKKYPPITVTAWAYITASLAMGLTSLYYVTDRSVYIIPTKVIWPLAYAIFVQTIFGYCCVSWANTHAPASLVAVYNSIQPIVAAVLSYFCFGEVFVWNEGVGTVLVLSGLGFVTWSRLTESKNSADNTSDNSKNNLTDNDNNEKTPFLSNAGINTERRSLILRESSVEDSV